MCLDLFTSCSRTSWFPVPKSILPETMNDPKSLGYVTSIGYCTTVFKCSQAFRSQAFCCPMMLDMLIQIGPSRRHHFFQTKTTTSSKQPHISQIHKMQTTHIISYLSKLRTTAAYKYGAARESAQTTWHDHSFQALVEILAKFQALKITWKVNSFQALVEILAKFQALKITWKVNSFQALVEITAKCQASKITWKFHSF